MPQKSFRKFGTVRSQNLSDIDNLTISLNNLLDKLVDGSSTYISEDLDCIRQISTTSLDNTGFLRFANNEESVLSPITLLNTPFVPNKTYQNRLDIIRTFTGEPRISGGNGLSAKYYNFDQIIIDRLNGDFGEQSAFNGTPVATETGTDQNTTWLNGTFNYNGAIQDAMTGFGGAVEWEGYFIPVTTGTHEFRAFTSGLYHMDWQADNYVEDQFGNKQSGDTYVTAKRIGLENKMQVKVVSTSAVQLVTISDKKFIGLSLKGSGSNLSSETLIGGFDDTTGIITFDGNTVTGSVDDTFELTVKKELGEEGYASYFTPVLEKYRRYRVKFRLLFPEKDTNGNDIPNLSRMSKMIDFELSSPLTSMSDIRYTRVYTRDYDFKEDAKGRMINFIDDSVLFGGGEIGEAKGSATGYVGVKTNKKVDIKYAPKTTLQLITKQSFNFNTVANTNFISLNNTSGIEIGNKVFGASVPANTEVTEIVINEGIFISNNFSSTSEDDPITIIEHRGFVKKVTGTTSGTTLTITGSGQDTSDLRAGMIVIGNDGTNGDFSNYTKITTIGDLSTLTLSSSKTTTSTSLYFYQGKGLINDSLIAFCLPAQTRCLKLTQSASITDTQLFVESGDAFDEVTTAWDAQGSAFDGNSSNINGKIIDPTATGTTAEFSITIDEGLVKPLAAGANFTVTSNSDSRILCCPPTDTSPPFEAIETGLRTTQNDPKLRLSQGNLIFDNLSAVDVPMGGGVSSIDSFQNTTDSSRTPGTYTDVFTGPSGNGTGATFNITVDGSGTVTNVTINKSGQGYVVNNTITVNDSRLGNGGAANFIFDVASISGDIYEISGNPTATKSILIETGVTAGDPTDTNNQGTTFKILCA